MLLFLPPLIALILTGSTTLLLSLGEWGEWGVPTLLVTLPPPMGFTPQDLLSARVSRLPPRLSIFASFTSQVPYPRQFLRSFMMVTIIPHLLGGFVMLLHLLSTIIMHLHLWRLHLHSLLCRCVLCLKRISLLLWHWTLPCSKQPSSSGSIGPSSTSSWRHFSCPGSLFFSVGLLSHCGSSSAFGAFQASCHQGLHSLFGCARHDPVLSSSTRVCHSAFR